MKQIFGNKRGFILLLFILATLNIFGANETAEVTQKSEVFSITMLCIITNIFLFGMLFLAHGYYLCAFKLPKKEFREYFENRKKRPVLTEIVIVYVVYVIIFLFLSYKEGASIFTYLLIIGLSALFVALFARWFYLTKKRLRSLWNSNSRLAAHTYATSKSVLS